MTNRRGFLGLLAHLPLVGVWFAKPKPLVRPFVIEATISDESIRALKNVAIIRWIPVTERVPPIRPWDTNLFGIIGQSKPVLVSGSLGVMSATRFQYDSGDFDWGSASLDDVTHWAELPQPPATPEEGPLASAQ